MPICCREWIKLRAISCSSCSSLFFFFFSFPPLFPHRGASASSFGVLDVVECMFNIVSRLLANLSMASRAVEVHVALIVKCCGSNPFLALVYRLPAQHFFFFLFFFFVQVRNLLYAQVYGSFPYASSLICASRSRSVAQMIKLTPTLL